MEMEFVRRMPQPEELMREDPISAGMKERKKERDRQIREILTGKDHRFLLIIGPCSADREDAVLEYLRRLAGVAEQVSEKIMIIPRVYTNKPRTRGTGYKGMLHQPDVHKGEDLLAGITAIRQMHARILGETGFSCADEMLYPSNYSYLSDLLSYVAVGARSVENQEHPMQMLNLSAM